MEAGQLVEWMGRIASLNPFMLYDLERSRQKDGQWEFTPSKHWHLEVGDVVTGGVAMHRTLGIHALFLLACPKAQPTYELLMFDSTSGKLTALFHFQTAAGSNQYHILDGPIVVWKERGAYMRVACSDSFTPHSLHIQTFIECYKGAESVVDKFWVFDWGETEQSESILLLFAQVTHHKPEDMEIDDTDSTPTWLCLNITISSQKMDVTVEPNRCLIPNDYGCIVTCVQLHKFHVVDSYGAIVPRHQFLVGTSYQQVVIFENGSLLHCVPLQEIPRNIVTMEVRDGQLAFAVETQEGRAATFKVTVKGIQECKTWTDVSCLLVGDFAGIGHDQLLVALHGGACVVSNVCVTDLVEFTANSKTEQQSQRATQPCPESLISALGALQVRKQEGEAYLMDLQRNLQRKSQLLESGVHFMKSLVAVKACDADQVMFESDHSLVNLLPGGNTDVVRPVVKLSSDSQRDRGVKFVHSWQRVVEQQWVVGVVIKNTMKFSLQDVCLSMVPAGGRMPQGCSSRILWLETGTGIAIPSSTKKQKLSPSYQPSDQENIFTVPPHKSACVVAKAPLPVLSTTTLDISLVCSWKRDQSNALSCEVAELGRVSLSVAEVVSGALNCNEESLHLWNGKCTLLPEEIDMKERQYQDLSCLLAVKPVVQLEARSSFTNLHRLPAMLKARLPLPPHAIREMTMSAKTVSKGDSKSAPSEVLDGIYLCITTNVHSAKINIMYRNTPQLALLLETMRSSLPGDISLQAITSCTETLATCLRCLGKELTARANSLRSYLHGNNDDESVPLHSSHSDTALIKLMHT